MTDNGLVVSTQHDQGRRGAAASSPDPDDIPVLPSNAAFWLAPAAVAAVVGVVAGLQLTGAAARSGISDPGALVRWGLPAAQMASYLSMAVVIGCLLFACSLVPGFADARRPRPGAAPDRDTEHPAFRRLMTAAAAAGVVWTLAAVVVTVLTYSDVSGTPLSAEPTFTAQLAYFVTALGAGRAWLAITVIAAVVTTLALGVRRLTGLALTALLALGATIPLSLIGHSASAGDHTGAASSLGLHLVGISLWVGGIGALAVAAPALGSLTGVTLRRFSAVAGIAFVLVAASGVINAAIRLGDWSALASPYGTLVIAKTVATLVLGGFGFAHRRWVIPWFTAGRLSARRALGQLIVGEVVVMAATMGLGVALSRSATPAPEELVPAPDASPALLLSGYELPPELTPARLLSEWRWDWLWVAVALLAAVGYLRGVWVLHRRGDAVPVLRTLSWLAGCAALVYVTSGGLSVYGRVMFSVHMVDHMALTMVVPLFLVVGAPVTLALRALRPRRDGTRGPREWILRVLHSRFSALITHPVVAAALFVGSLVVFYYTPLFGFAMTEYVGHELMNLHFLLTGYLFLLVLIGTDPLPRRPVYPLRLVLLLATMAFHAFFGVTLMSSTTLLQPDYFGNLGRPWGLSPIADQQLGGAFAWGIGEIPTVLVAIGVAVMWSRADSRESRRRDRAADRNNEAELSAYNDMFARLARHDPGTGQPADGGGAEGADRRPGQVAQPTRGSTRTVPHDTPPHTPEETL
ncbi:cytochrome c oxidase assembly protein [Tersicoccus phoenicis]|uniref:cytochrome c oxidase assembly protein n=1 Tax=Tersicoccus phoenicis TaxID=554083 RepID=UPI000A028EA3